MIGFKHNLECYSDKVSAFVGDTIDFKVNSSQNFSISFERIETNETLLKINDLTKKVQHQKRNAFLGVNWETSYTLTIPSNWKSGIYAAVVKSQIKTAYCFFIIRGQNNKIAVLASTHTWQAYNYWGGNCFYKNLQACEGSPIISYNRPLESKVPDYFDKSLKEKPFGKNHIMNYERLLLKWLNANNYQYDVVADPNLDTDLNNYKILIIGCHSEYWTKSMYDALEKFVENKGKIVYLGGNALYWKVSTKDSFIICDKINQDLWRKEKPESKILGVQYNYFGYKTHADYQVIIEDHWIFENTNLKKGDNFCPNGSAWETDKTCEYTPDDTIILAKGLNPDNGGAEMVYRHNVFSVGSVGFTLNLDDPITSQIVKNVLNRFLICNFL